MNTITALGVGLKHVFVDNQIGLDYMENREETISRLKFIGMIKKEEKINVRHVNIQPNTVYTKISRAILYPDNRNNTLKFIKDVILRAFEIIEHYNFQGNILLSRGIVADLLKTKQGILNLKYTYADDTKFCCDMDVMIETISSKINELKVSHANLFENVEL